MKFGDSITVLGRRREGGEEICKLNIAGIVDTFEPYTPDNYQILDYNTIIIALLSKDSYEKEVENGTIELSNIYISTDKPYEIDRKIEEFNNSQEDEYLWGKNLYDERLQEESKFELFKFILYVFDILIISFCMFNIFNIISSSTIFRKRDFAILKSLGMSEKQINKMLCFEGILYGFSGIIFGTIFSFIVLYVLEKIGTEIGISQELYIFKYPFVQIIYAIILVYAVILFAMLSARKKIKDRNIIEDVKNDVN